jgi:hypothetical protein
MATGGIASFYMESRIFPPSNAQRGKDRDNIEAASDEVIPTVFWSVQMDVTGERRLIL